MIILCTRCWTFNSLLDGRYNWTFNKCTEIQAFFNIYIDWEIVWHHASQENSIPTYSKNHKILDSSCIVSPQQPYHMAYRVTTCQFSIKWFLIVMIWTIISVVASQEHQAQLRESMYRPQIMLLRAVFYKGLFKPTCIPGNSGSIHKHVNRHIFC